MKGFRQLLISEPQVRDHGKQWTTSFLSKYFGFILSSFTCCNILNNLKALFFKFLASFSALVKRETLVTKRNYKNVEKACSNLNNLSWTGTISTIMSHWNELVHFKLLEYGLCDFRDNSNITQMALIHGVKLKPLAITNSTEWILELRGTEPLLD